MDASEDIATAIETDKPQDHKEISSSGIDAASNNIKENIDTEEPQILIDEKCNNEEKSNYIDPNSTLDAVDENYVENHVEISGQKDIKSNGSASADTKDDTFFNQDDSALCVSPKSLNSCMDTSSDKILDIVQEVEVTANTPGFKKDDSGICFDKVDLEDCNVEKSELCDMNQAFDLNSVSNNSDMNNVEVTVTAKSINIDNTTLKSDESQTTTGNYLATEKVVFNINDSENCDKCIEDEVKSIDLDSDDLSCDDTKTGKKDTFKEKRNVSGSEESDISGLNTYEVNPSTSKGTPGDQDETKSKKSSDSSSNNSDIEQEMDALDLFLSRRKRRRDSNHSSHSSQANNNDNDENDERDSQNRDSDDNEETKSDDSDHSESDTEYDLTPPPDSWTAIKEFRAREIGFGNKVYVAENFRSKLGGSVRLAQRLKRNCRLENHDGCVNALHFNKSGTLLASGSDDLNIVVWNWLHVKPYFVFDSGHRSNVFQCKFMPYTGDSHIVSCARDGQVRLAELSSTGICKGTKKLAQHRGAAHKLSLLEDSSHVFYSCGEDAVVYSIDLREDKPNKLCTTKENDKKIPLYSIHSNPMKSFEYCVGGRDHYLRIYDKRMMGGDGTADNVLKKYCPHHLIDSDIKANVTCAVYNWDGQEVLGTYNDEDIYLFDNTHSDGAEFIHRYKGHRNNATVKGINFYGPKSEFIVSGSDCGNVFLWEKQTEKIVNYFHADDGGVVNVLEPHPHMPVLATSGLDHDVKIWMPMGGETTKMDGLAKRIKKNNKERERERVNEPEMLDGRMLWFLMHHLRRARRRPSGDGDSSTDSDDVERGESEPSDDDEEPMQCASS